MFESGRKCPTGEGLFAFKCAKSKRLNDTLHKVILNNATSLYNLQNNANSNEAVAMGNHASSSDTDHLLSGSKLRVVNNANNSNNLNGLTIAYSTNRVSRPPQPDSTNLVLKENKNIVNEDLIYHTPTEYASLSLPDSSSPRTANQESANGLRQSELIDREPSPYYVNDIKSLVRLPISLSSLSMEPSRMTSSATTSTMTAGTGSPTHNEYINCDQIDPTLMHLAQQLSAGTNNNLSPPTSKIKSLFSSYSIASGNYFKPSLLTLSSKSSAGVDAEPSTSVNLSRGERVARGLLDSSSSSLNYIVPERVGMNKSASKQTAPPTRKSSLKKPSGGEKLSALVNNENVRVDLVEAENRSEYCVMDPKKTTATTKTCSDMSKQRRLEHANTRLN